MPPRRLPFTIAGHEVSGGRRSKIEIPFARLMSGTTVSLPIIVWHGKTAGPTAWVSAAIHGDEIEGVEIIRRVAQRIQAQQMRGTVIAIPVVNVHGFNTGDRYLPDRRDLNRSFPGSRRGSLAGRLAHLVMDQIVSRCDYGVDLHTGSDHRTNLAQIRADLDDAETLRLAEAFGAPLLLHSKTRDGSLRQAATERGAKVLLYEGGEAWRFDEKSIEAGVSGVLRVLAETGFIDPVAEEAEPALVARSSRWVRSGRSGIIQREVELGSRVATGEVVARIHDTFGKKLGDIKSRTTGIVIGHTQHPLVNRG
ncbi:MAG: succinylglutamate desuccinylase/aspartoacylase family protein, partial [Acidimicrobiia bacterium]|nr:succinylglutamate desuccinylase/aspartoacylase family protein [Acidimicrobiia bacterium]